MPVNPVMRCRQFLVGLRLPPIEMNTAVRSHGFDIEEAQKRLHFEGRVGQGRWRER